MRKIIVILFAGAILAFGPVLNVKSQNGINIDTEVVSSYLWRGQLFSPTLNLQPSVTFTGLGEKLSAGAWGSFAVGNFFNEIDLFVSLSLNNFTFTVTDYYTITSETDYRFFDLKPKTTGHAFEAIAEWQISETFPLQLTWGTFVYGADLNEDQKSLFSSYFEAAYSFAVNEIPLALFAGVTPWKSFYAKKFAVVNIGFSAEKTIKVTENFALPVKGTFAINPYDQRTFLVLSVLF